LEHGASQGASGSIFLRTKKQPRGAIFLFMQKTTNRRCGKNDGSQ
jgi:hypothetical protein